MKNQFEVIECPVCHCQYLPCEIYLPNSFLGKVKNINRDHITGKIDTFYGKSMDLKEHYICDRCNTPFKVISKVQFFTKEEEEFNFNKEYATSLHKPSLFLNED